MYGRGDLTLVLSNPVSDDQSRRRRPPSTGTETDNSE